MSRIRRGFRALMPLALLVVSGCILRTPDPAVAPVTQIDPKLATQEYWFGQPAVVSVKARDFFALWGACRSVAHDCFFVIDREDYREGLLSTQPLVSKQYWELWRRDAVRVADIEASSLATIRRTIHFQIRQQDNGTYVVEPKVIVERFASMERRLTAITEYHTAFSGPRPFGSETNDEGLQYPTDYWYATGRDEALERDLAGAVRRELAD